MLFSTSVCVHALSLDVQEFLPHGLKRISQATRDSLGQEEVQLKN